MPGASAARQRHDSYTSTGGSWQVVTVTGSIDSMPNGSLTKRMAEQRETSDNREDNSGNGENVDNGDNNSSNTASASKEEAAPSSSTKPPETP